MSHYFGKLQSLVGCATMSSLKTKRFTASVQTLSESIIVSLSDHKDGTMVCIEAEDEETDSRILWSGPLSDLLHNDAKITVERAK